MNKMSWDQLRILKAVLESGSLSGAARRLGVSQPTVSRQVHALEDALGKSLVETTSLGVAPTAHALSLTSKLDAMTGAAREIFTGEADPDEMRAVRISCGPWISTFLCQNASALVDDDDSCRVEIVSTTDFVDVSRREAEIAIRNKRPRGANLQSKPLPSVAFAAYGARSLVEGKNEAFDDRRFKSFRWAGLTQDRDHYSSSRWLAQRLKVEPSARCSSSTHLLHCVESGHFLAMLPCFAAGVRPNLCRVSEPVVLDMSSLWMVYADDMPRRPPVRFIANRIVELFSSAGSLLAGELASD